MNRAIRILLITFLMIAGCGDTTVTPDTGIPEVTGPVDPYGDPPDYSGDPFENFPEVTGLSIPDNMPEVEYEEEILTGTHFTVQISAATSEETALRLSESVSADIVHPVFIDLEGGYWKVRVGAFPARQDALDYTQILVNMGFTDAWVTTRVP